MESSGGVTRNEDGQVQITIHRRLAWMDTDAAERWHHTTFFRYAEDAEAALHRTLGIETITFGATPRVHVEADFLAPIYFDDLVAITLTVAALGRTSVTYDIEVARDDTACAKGRMVTVLTDGKHGGTTPWPDMIVTALGPEPAPTGS